MAWKLIDHRADAGFEAEGETLEEVFTDGTAAFLFICTGMTAEELLEREGKEDAINMTAEDGEELAVSWFNELLFRMETKSEVFIPQTIKVSLSPPSIEAMGRTVRMTLDSLSVKAATYGQMKLRAYPRPFLRIFLDL